MYVCTYILNSCKSIHYHGHFKRVTPLRHIEYRRMYMVPVPQARRLLIHISDK
jgi:hypothetical protein